VNVRSSRFPPLGERLRATIETLLPRGDSKIPCRGLAALFETVQFREPDPLAASRSGQVKSSCAFSVTASRIFKGAESRR